MQGLEDDKIERCVMLTARYLVDVDGAYYYYVTCIQVCIHGSNYCRTGVSASLRNLEDRLSRSRDVISCV